jgi:hypothetical protein
MPIKGSSTGQAPNQPNNITSTIKNQKKGLKMGLNLGLLTIEISIIGKSIRINIAATIQNTPPNLSGIDLKIA